MEMLMNNRKLFFVAAILMVVAMLGVDSSAANKDMVQLQTQIQALQDQMARMQQSFDERMGVMRNLVEQNTDTMNKLTTTMTQLQQTLQKQSTDTSGRTDQLSGQLQTLNDSLDELKARLARVASSSRICSRRNRMFKLRHNLGRHRDLRSSRSRSKLRRPTCSITMVCGTITRQTGTFPRRVQRLFEVLSQQRSRR